MRPSEPAVLMASLQVLCSENLRSTFVAALAMKVRGFPGIERKPQYKKVMNWKRFFLAFIAAFIFLFVFGFLWYATLMHGAHREVATLLRPEADLQGHFSWLIVGHLVMAFFFTLLCARYVPDGRSSAGAMLGILVGLVLAGPHLISFAVQPLTFKILCGWTAGAVIQFAIAGAIVGAIYKPATSHIMYVKERSR
jgi:magnesium-transporting ATPase (P-type)